MIPLAFRPVHIGIKGAPVIEEADELRLRARFGGEFEILKTEDGGVRLKVPGEASHRFDEAIKGLSANIAHKDLLYRNCLISLVSSAEWFLSQVLREFFESVPEASGVKDKTLTLEDLRRIGSIDEAESYLISLRVDEIMWGGLHWTIG